MGGTFLLLPNRSLWFPKQEPAGRTWRLGDSIAGGEEELTFKYPSNTPPNFPFAGIREMRGGNLGWGEKKGKMSNFSFLYKFRVSGGKISFGLSKDYASIKSPRGRRLCVCGGVPVSIPLHVFPRCWPCCVPCTS